jgi:hypothetical protein
VNWFRSLAVALVFVFGAGLVVAASSATCEEVPADIEIKSDIYDEHTKGIVQFNHLEHAEDYGIACADCHHVYENGENVWEEGDPVQKCSECHDDPTIDVKEIRQMSKEDQIMVLREAYHDNCKGCHIKHKRENRESPAPISCTQCHGK